MAVPSISNKNIVSANNSSQSTSSKYFKVPSPGSSPTLIREDTTPVKNPDRYQITSGGKTTRTTDPNFKKKLTARGYSQQGIRTGHFQNSAFLDDHTMGSGDNAKSIDYIVDKLNKTLNLENSTDTVDANYKKMASMYNRFKVPMPNSMLQKGFAHVFFVKPSCHIFTSTTGNTEKSLVSGVSGNNLFRYAMQSGAGRAMLKELSEGFGSDDFLLSLSNAAISFSPQDEYISDDTYGRGYTGYKIAFGKHNVESKTAGSFDVEFQDDRDMHIYQLHKLWEEYISCVYRGEFVPTMSNIQNKILDYAGSLYYIITAEDGETVLFWSKYYGVFPTTAPTTHLSWASGNALNGESTRFSVTYKFSFKTDFDPFVIGEFNKNSGISGGTKLTSVPVYDKKLGHAGTTWVGVPFIEAVSSESGEVFHYKLRFKPNAKKEM